MKNHEQVTGGSKEQPPSATTRHEAGREAIPEPREASSGEGAEDQSAVKMFPYHDGVEAGNLLLFKMPPEERDKVCDMLLRDREKRTANVS
ncbi:hypothetical protein ACWDE9_41125 [Streptomyces olivaceoviridis]